MIKMRLVVPLLIVFASSAMALPPQKTQSFWTRVVRFFGVSASPSNQKGEEGAALEGDIHIYDVTTRFGSKLKSGTFRSPIFLPTDKAILALSGDKVVKIDLETGTATELVTVPGIKKLVGVDKEAPEEVLILSDLDNDNCPNVGVLALADGVVTNVPYGRGNEDQDLVTHLRNWDREYDGGDTKLEVKSSTKKVNGINVTTTDAFLKRKDMPLVNLSRCPSGVACGQPSISNDRKFVVFVGKV